MASLQMFVHGIEKITLTKAESEKLDNGHKYCTSKIRITQDDGSETELFLFSTELEKLILIEQE